MGAPSADQTNVCAAVTYLRYGQRGGPAWGLQNCDSKMDSIFGVRITGQEVLKDELQKLKGQQTDLRKAMRQNRKEARNATKRKNRLVKALRKLSEGESFQFTARAIFCANSATFNPILLIVRFLRVPSWCVCTLL